MTYPVALGIKDFYNEIRNDPEVAAFGPYADEVAAQRLMGHQAMAVGQAGEFLEKAMSLTGIKASGGTTGGDAGKLEDLLPVITKNTIDAKYFAPYWNAVNKRPAISDYIENTLLNDLGAGNGLGFVDVSNSTGGGQDNNPSLLRANQVIKFFSRGYTTNIAAKLVTAQGLSGAPAPGNLENINKWSALQRLTVDLNYQLWNGNTTTNALEANGVLTQIRAAHTGQYVTRYDCQGNPLTPEILAEITQITFAQGGVHTDFWYSPLTLADTQKQLLPNNRSRYGETIDILNDPAAYLSTRLGGDIQRIKFNRDLHLDPLPTDLDASIAGDSGAPAAPSAVACTAQSDSTGNAFGRFLSANTYYYWVRAVGIKGRSAATAGDTSVTPNGTSQKARLVITSADNATQKFEILRSTVNTASTAKKIGEVIGALSSSTSTFNDQGEKVPGTATAVALCDMPQPDGYSSILVRHLMPMMHFDLPITLTTRPGAWMAAMTPQVRAPRFNVVIENIGRFV